MSKTHNEVVLTKMTLLINPPLPFEVSDPAVLTVEPMGVLSRVHYPGTITPPEGKLVQSCICKQRKERQSQVNIFSK